MKKRVALYPGSFDPPTHGHLDLIKRALTMFDEVVVGVVRNPGKHHLFTLEERVELLGKLFAKNNHVKVTSFDGLLVDFVKKLNNPVVIRGLRVISDFEYEFQMALMNRKISKGFEVVFLTPDEKYTYLSSTMVREIARLGGPLEDLVPSLVAKEIKNRV